MNDYCFEVVEVCPHCSYENVYPMWDVNVNGYIAICKNCGQQIFLCDECKHSDDNENIFCNWCKTECGGKCFRGVIKSITVKQEVLNLIKEEIESVKHNFPFTHDDEVKLDKLVDVYNLINSMIKE